MDKVKIDNVNKVILIAIASFFGVIFIITTYSLYGLICLMKQEKGSDSIKPVLGSLSCPRVSRVYCNKCVYNTNTRVTSFTILNEHQVTEKFFLYLSKYDRIIIGKYILQVDNVSKTRDAIMFDGLGVDATVKHFIPLTAYSTFPIDVKQMHNRILWVIHLSSEV
jgi:hypothetical protein